MQNASLPFSNANALIFMRQPLNWVTRQFLRLVLSIEKKYYTKLRR